MDRLPSEILKDKTRKTLTINEGSPLHDAVLEAMREYAEQEAKAYASWLLHQVIGIDKHSSILMVGLCSSIKEDLVKLKESIKK